MAKAMGVSALNTGSLDTADMVRHAPSAQAAQSAAIACKEQFAARHGRLRTR